MILYLGNFLPHQDINPTYSFSLAQKLRQRYTLRTAGSARGRLHRLVQMCWAALTTSPRVVLIDAYATRAFWYLVVVCPILKILGKPYILLLHSGAWVVRWQTHTKRSQYILKHAHTVVCTSRYLYQHLPCYQAKAVVIHNFGEALIPPTLHQKYNQKVLWVREYQPRYGDEDVLKLALLLEEQGCKSAITMVGPKRETLLPRWEATGQPWPKNIHFKDRLTPKEWHTLAAQHSLFLNTSQVDSFPISLIQALALGLPVLSTKAGGIPEMIEPSKNGWLVEIGEVEAMATLIGQLEKDAMAITSLSKNAHESSQLLTWDAIAPQWHQLLTNFFQPS